ncbi:MAG: hypothetical protein EBU92_12250 [Betaproteobacteria bacterium]|nr:hypothetical protein [Betaproteobacteria bacterium]
MFEHFFLPIFFCLHIKITPPPNNEFQLLFCIHKQSPGFTACAPPTCASDRASAASASDRASAASASDPIRSVQYKPADPREIIGRMPVMQLKSLITLMKN